MIIKFIKFGIVGISALLLEAFLILSLNKIGIAPGFCRIISLPIAIFFTWYFNRNFTFQNKDPKKLKQIIKYYLFTMIGVTFNYLMYLFSLKILNNEDYKILIALCIGSASSMTINFLFSKFFVFKK